MKARYHLLILLPALLVPASLPAQGTQADYRRAAELHKLTENKVFPRPVKPNWLAGGTRFWYRNELADHAHEFVLVDAERGTRQPAFDHQRLAAAMSKQAGRPIDARRLPLDGLDFRPGEPSLRFRWEGKTWACDLKTYDLHEHAAEGDAAATLSSQDTPHASTHTGEATTLVFVNRTQGEVRLYWIDTRGKRKRYPTLKPGQRYEQPTFAGHVWLATDRDGKTLGVFEATAAADTVVIDQQAAARAAAQPPPARRPQGTLASGDRSPDGRWQAFFKNANLFLRDVKTGAESPLSTDGTAADEYTGPICWSPDSQKLVVLRTTKPDDRQVYYVESSPPDQLQPKLHHYGYLKPGDRIAQPRPRLFDMAGRKGVPISDALFPNPWSVDDIRWAADSRRFTFAYNQRGHQVLRIIAVDAAGGQARPIVDEQGRTFIDYSGKHFVQYLDASGEIIWMSERDGWNHLYLYDAQTGRVKNPITRGPWVVRGVDLVDEAKRQIWFRAGGIRPGQDPYYVHHCRVNFDGSGLVVLTEGDGTHTISYSPDRRWLIDAWSRVDLAPVTELRRSDDGRLVCALEKADWSRLLDTGWQTPERFTAKGRDGQTEIYGVIFRPTNFDAKRRYPVLEDIYAGPQSAFVPKPFHAFHGQQAMAELGFIVVKIDGMGTSHRSKAFHDVCWKNLADAGLPDRILWIKAAAAKYPYMDTSRVGIYGGSAGGQSALGALLTHGDFYKVAVADCGCHDNRMDKIWWNEQWMGWPIGPHYAEQSNVTLAPRLQGKLLLVVGEMDENVDPASTMQVVNALVKADKDFDLLVVPGSGHGSAESPYGSRRRQDFFVRHLLGVEPRR